MPDNLYFKVKRAWNAFFNKDPTEDFDYSGPSSYTRLDRPTFSYTGQKTVVNSIYNKIAVDASNIKIRHVMLDEFGKYKSMYDSRLNDCLTLSANIDQTGPALIQDLVMSMFDEGKVAVVPVDTTDDPNITDSFDILSLRVGSIKEWYPLKVKVNLYDERTGSRRDIILDKRHVAIIENPFYATMNESNSTLKRLIRKLALLDYVDEQSGSGKLNLIIELPYPVRTDGRRKQAEKRKADLENQLVNSKYGIAYTDGTEKVTQLNRAIDNNLSEQVKNLTEQLYKEIGLTPKIFDGTASDSEYMNYQSGTLNAILSAIVLEFKRKFLSKTAITQRQSIEYFNEPFKLVPVAKLAEIADKFTRNEIMSANEVRQIIGLVPSTDPKADELRNANIKRSDAELAEEVKAREAVQQEGEENA